jgi:hypothetical protein
MMGRREKAFQLTRGAPFDLTHSEDWHERPPPPPQTLSVVFPNPFNIKNLKCYVSEKIEIRKTA